MITAKWFSEDTDMTGKVIEQTGTFAAIVELTSKMLGVIPVSAGYLVQKGRINVYGEHIVSDVAKVDSLEEARHIYESLISQDSGFGLF